MNIPNFQAFYERYKRANKKAWHEAKIGDVLEEEVIYNYIQGIHRDYDDFVDGDLGERIERYSKYRLELVDINRIDDSHHRSKEMLKKYLAEYESDHNYPPVVLDHKHHIIDGTHRVGVLKKLDVPSVLAWVGIQ